MKRKLLAVLIAAALAAPAAALAQGTTAPKDTGMTKDRPAAPRASEPAPRSKGSSPDALITGKVKTGFVKDKIVRSRNYNVDTKDGVVTVKGTARSQAEADRAIEIAKSTEGVTSVNNEIKVRAAADKRASSKTGDSSKRATGARSSTEPSDPLAKNEEPRKDTASTAPKRSGTASTGSTASKEGGSPDALITTKVKAEHAMDKAVSASTIKVETNNGVVTLSGTAKSKAEADKAVALAKNVKGVTSVKNEIKVEAK